MSRHYVPVPELWGSEALIIKLSDALKRSEDTAEAVLFRLARTIYASQSRIDGRLIWTDAQLGRLLRCHKAPAALREIGVLVGEEVAGWRSLIGFHEEESLLERDRARDRMRKARELVAQAEEIAGRKVDGVAEARKIMDAFANGSRTVSNAAPNKTGEQRAHARANGSHASGPSSARSPFAERSPVPADRPAGRPADRPISDLGIMDHGDVEGGPPGGPPAASPAPPAKSGSGHRKAPTGARAQAIAAVMEVVKGKVSPTEEGALRNGLSSVAASVYEGLPVEAAVGTARELVRLLRNGQAPEQPSAWITQELRRHGAALLSGQAAGHADAESAEQEARRKAEERERFARSGEELSQALRASMVASGGGS